ncbi:MAG: hypothetical protein EON94_03125 [Caulobacteraceae bacterium]|nr:MAG: hypothetical protein EON94_03125 [Caulobacteraceae bacterium]
MPTTTLARRLKHLEATGLIERRPYQERPTPRSTPASPNTSASNEARNENRRLVEDEMFFGNDRLDFLRQSLKAAA